jgi:hypothetical protein
MVVVDALAFRLIVFECRRGMMVMFRGSSEERLFPLPRAMINVSSISQPGIQH